MKHLYTRSPGIPRPPGSLHRSSLQDLFTRPLWEISLQELSTRSLHKTSMRDLYTRSPRSLHRSSLQDLFTRPLWEISIQDLLISLDLWDLLTTRSLQKTSIRIQHAESTERVARTKSKSAPRYSESDPTRTNSAEGCTSRNQKCPRLSASDIPSAKWARRYSQSDRTRTKSREGCICKHKIGAAPQRDSKNHSSDRTLTSELQYEMRFFDVLWRKYCACHEKMSPRHTKSCNCHAKWCQHSRAKFDDSFTKRAFRALQDRLQEHQILRLPRKMAIFHHLQFRATLTTILHTSQNPHVLHISRFPKIDTARRRERTSEMDLVGAPFRAGEMHFFDLDHNFSPRGSPKNPHASAHTADLHQMLFSYRKNPIVWPHCLGKKTFCCKSWRSKMFLPQGYLADDDVLQICCCTRVVGSSTCTLKCLMKWAANIKGTNKQDLASDMLFFVAHVHKKNATWHWSSRSSCRMRGRCSQTHRVDTQAHAGEVTE